MTQTNIDINIEDLVEIKIDSPTSFTDRLQAALAVLQGRTIVHTFDNLTMDKTTARKIYKRAYPKAKV